jgi:FkbM family methyltransferase
MEKENYDILSIIKNKNEYKGENLILDIGCHKGDFVLGCSNFFGSNINIIGFEPDENNYKILIENVKNFKNCKIIKKAIYYTDKKEAKVLGVGDNNPGGYMVEFIDSEHVNKNMFPKLHHYNEQVFYLSQLEEYCNSAWLIKLDCEASEWNIIENSSVVKNTDHIILEFHNHDINYALIFVQRHLPNHEVKYISERHVYLTKK